MAKSAEAVEVTENGDSQAGVKSLRVTMEWFNDAGELGNTVVSTYWGASKEQKHAAQRVVAEALLSLGD